MLIAAMEISSDFLRPAIEVGKDLESCYAMIQTFQEAEKKSDYQIEKLLEAL